MSLLPTSPQPSSLAHLLSLPCTFTSTTSTTYTSATEVISQHSNTRYHTSLPYQMLLRRISRLDELSTKGLKMHYVWLLFLLCGSVCIAELSLFQRNNSINTRDDEGYWYPFVFIRRPGAAADDPVSLAKARAIQNAYYEAVELAALAYDLLDETDPIYIRYFRDATEWVLVKGRFAKPLHCAQCTDTGKKSTERYREPKMGITDSAAEASKDSTFAKEIALTMTLIPAKTTLLWPPECFRTKSTRNRRLSFLG
jgi:hypothetical protein